MEVNLILKIISLSYNGSQIQIWKPFISAIPNFTKNYIPEMLKDTKEIPMRHLLMTIFNSRKSGRHPDLEWIFIALIVISALTLLGLGLTPVFYICHSCMNNQEHPNQWLQTSVSTDKAWWSLLSSGAPICSSWEHPLDGCTSIQMS